MSREPTPPSLLAVVRAGARENGWAWASWLLLDQTALRSSDLPKRRMRGIERSRGLTGLHTKEANRDLWNSYDWSDSGEEWTNSAEWRQALIDEAMLREMPASSTSLEIGPGGGRWTEALLGASERLVLTDIAEQPLELCRKRFADRGNIAYHVTDGSSLSAVETDSIDFVWSFDAFVHIAPADQERYLQELARVMRPSARAVIHHAGRGGLDGGWRSSMTGERFRQLVAVNGFRLIRQFDSWGPAAVHKVPIPGDLITVFELSQQTGGYSRTDLTEGD